MNFYGGFYGKYYAGYYGASEAPPVPSGGGGGGGGRTMAWRPPALDLGPLSRRDTEAGIESFILTFLSVNNESTSVSVK